ncbi:hypothetical protein BH23ACT3_BH23ACT3_14230 [soil metagenome]
MLDDLLSMLAQLTGASLADVVVHDGPRSRVALRHGTQPGAGAHDPVDAPVDEPADDPIDDPADVPIDDAVEPFAAVPLLTPDGHEFASLRFVGHAPGPVGDAAADALATVARLVQHELELLDRSDQLGVVSAELATALEERRLDAQRFTLLAESMPAMVWTANSGRQIDYANPAFYEYVGDIPNEVDIADGGWTFVIHPDDLPSTVERWDLAITDGSPFSTETRIRRHDGRYRWHLVTAQPVPDEHGRVAAWFGAATDVHDRLRSETLQHAEARIFELIAAGGALTLVLHEIVRTLDLVNGGASSMMLVDDSAGRLLHGAAPNLPPEFVAAVDGIEIDAAVGSCGPAVLSRREVVTTDLTTDPAWHGYRDQLMAAGFSSCVSTPVLNANGRAVAVIAQYLTEAHEYTDAERAVTERITRLASIAIDRLRADAELRTSARLLRVASRLGVLGGWSVAIPPTRVTWSDEVCAIHEVPVGFRPTVAEAIAYYAPEHLGLISEALTTCVDRGVPYDLQAEIITATGRRIWCRTIGEAHRDESGTIVRVAGALQNITAFKEAEQAMAESEERFRLLSRATSDVVFDWDIESDTIWYGEGLDAWVGPLNNPILTMGHVTRRLHPDDVEYMTSSLQSFLASDRELWCDRFRLLRVDGTEFAVEASGLVTRNAAGRATRLIGSLVDMTAQYALEQQLAQSQRLEAVGQLTGGVAHDFNNLLTVILGNADMLIEDLDDHDLRSLAEMVRMAAERGAELTSQLLAFARRQPLAPTVVDVAALIEGLHGLLHRTLGEDVDLRFTRDDALWPAMVDAAQFESAVLNVCLNAREAMQGGGRLTIELANDQLDERYAATQPDLEPGHYVMISISDSGSGMAPHVLERVFEPFFTTKWSGRGSGLGLSMVYGFAKQSRGHVRISSDVDVGTTVTLYLPRAGGTDPDGVAAPGTVSGAGSTGASRSVDGPSPAPVVGGNERILLVEDDELVRDVAAARLRALCYDVAEAADGHSALEMLRDSPPFALLFTDVVMPGGIDGRQLADAARALRPDLPVLFTSGYSEDAIAHHGRLDPGVDLLSKPYRFDELAARIRRSLDDVSAP